MREGIATSRVQSGLLLIGVGVALNVLGRVLIAIAGEQWLLTAGMLFAFMFGSVVIGVFGIVYLVIGLITKS